MLLVRLLNEFFALWRDLGTSSRESANLLIEEDKSLAVVV
jgi:hypothetical protein